MDAKQQIPLELPSKPPQQTIAKPDALTNFLLYIFQTRVIDVLPALGFVFLTYNVVDALFKAEGDCKTMSIVVFTYANLIGLFYCLKLFEKLLQGKSSRRTKLKIAMLIFAFSLCLPFSTWLNLSFSSSRVTSILDSVVMSSCVWTLAVATTFGAFYCLSVLPDDEAQTQSF